MTVESVDRRPIGRIAPALLEDWLRDRYFELPIDISSSGVQDYSVGQLRDILGITARDLDEVQFRDSPSVGCLPLRQAIADRFGDGGPETVMVTHGSTEALFLALAALVSPGDEIVVLQPVYHSLHAIAETLGARLRVWRLDPEDGFTPDLDRFRDLLNERTKAVLVNFPHNPTGTTLSAAAYEEFLDLIARHDCHLLWDGAFTELVYDGPPLPDPRERLERAVSVGTLSKAYGLPGMRVGWCMAPAGLLTTMVKVRDYVSIATSPLAEFLATAVLRDGDRIAGRRLRQAAANREVLRAWALEDPEHIDLPVPLGGVSAFPAVRGVADVREICGDLEAHGVLVVPGFCFGYPDRMRIGFGGPPGVLRAGLRAISEVVGGPAGGAG
ncbi:capreomycidine synthase [Sphaerisporangium corydalis]|uniref:Capreomycidine synthase n=1 Tax=Sphaerisporangium corydalis TaxID=1441875 RepID=A0ABV9EBZ6_9ACTN|nr:capreomycidine synthase [Sphaerisporangium corydalis]